MIRFVIKFNKTPNKLISVISVVGVEAISPNNQIKNDSEHTFFMWGETERHHNMKIIATHATTAHLFDFYHIHHRPSVAPGPVLQFCVGILGVLLHTWIGLI